MRIQYVGLDNDSWKGDGIKPRRGAEITCRYDDDERYTDKRDEKLFERTIQLLKINGWKFTEGIPGWAFCEVFDRDEYEEFRRDYLACKRCIQNCMKFGF